MSEAVKRALELIEGNKIKIGLKAGYYYPDFWCRDALISVLGLCAEGSEAFLSIAKKCISTCLRHQKFTGQIPNKISPDGKKVDFGEGGCVDSSLWMSIACFAYLKASDDKSFVRRNLSKIEKAVKWALNLDLNNDWLIETNEGSDWMDLLLRSGRVLYDNVLLYAALIHAHALCEEFGKNSKYAEYAEKVKESINLLFWMSKENYKKVNELYGFTGIEKDYEIAFKEGGKPYFITELGFRKYDPRFDVYSNILALLFGVADEEKQRMIMHTFEEMLVSKPYPVRILIPPISRADPFWCFYFRETDLGFLQDPGNFHNGACWPFVGGFYIALLRKEGVGKWKEELEKLREECALENWSFYEWVNPFTCKPGGSPEQTWSGAMLLFAEKEGEKLLVQS